MFALNTDTLSPFTIISTSTSPPNKPRLQSSTVVEVLLVPLLPGLPRIALEQVLQIRTGRSTPSGISARHIETQLAHATTLGAVHAAPGLRT